MATSLNARPAARSHSARRVGLVAYLFAVTMAGTTLPSPLYPLYQQRLGFGAATTTVIYAVYAAGVLAALLLFGRASDAVGRRPVLAAALLAAGASALVFLFGDDLAALVVGRVLSGLSAGLVTAAATAAMVDQARAERRAAATAAASAVSMFGLGLGPLLAGSLASYAPWALRLPFVVHVALLVPAVLVLRIVPRTSRPTNWTAALRPQRPRVAPEVRTVFRPAALAAFATFAVFGLLTAVEPGLLATVLGRSGHVLAGATTFAMFAGSAVGQVTTSRWTFRRSLPVGCLTLVGGLVFVTVGLTAPSLVALLIGTVVVGLGQGTAFRAGMSAVTTHSPDERRGESVAAFMVVAYVAISIPVVLVGVLSSATTLRAAALVLSALAAVLAVGAAVVLGRSRE